MRTARDESAGVEALVVGAPLAPMRPGFDETTRPIECVDGVANDRKIEKDQRATESGLQQLLGHSPAVIYKLLVDGERVVPFFISANLASFLEVTVGEALGIAGWWQQQVHPDDLATALAAVAAAIAHGESCVEYRIRHGDGTYRVVEDKKQLVCDVNGRPKEIVGSWTDITERRRAEEILRTASSRHSNRRTKFIIGELVLIGLAVVLFEVGGHRFGFFKWVFTLLANETLHPFFDEAAGVAIFLIGASLVFSYRRWHEGRAEIVLQSHVAEALRCLHGELDLRVKQRTMQLRLANEALRAEVAERKKAEEAAGLIRALLDQSNDAIEVIDVETGRYLDVNEKACQERGYDRAEYLAMTVFEMDTELNRASYAAHTEQLRRAGKMTLESRHRRKGGSRFPVEVSLSFVTRDRDYLVAIVRDITERKRAEERIADALNYNRTMLEASPVAILTYTIDGAAVETNQAAARMLGATIEQLHAQNFRQIESWKNSGMRAAVERAFASDLEQTIETHFTSTFGKEISISANFVPFTYENSRHVLVMMTDIAAQKRAETALREAESKYHSIFDNAVDGIFRSTAEGQFLAVNPAMVRILGYDSVEELIQVQIGVPWLRCGRPEESAKLKLLVEEQTDIVRLEYQACRKSGEKIWVSENIRTMRGVNGNVCCYEGTLEDVTALKTMRTQLLEVSRQADMAEVATGVLHNVGNVFNSVNVSSTLVTEKLGNSHLGYLGKAVALLREHEADLGAFLTSDPRGRQLPGYLGMLAVNLAKERESVVEEVELLRKNVDHIKDIISLQQSYAKVSGLVEAVSVTELIEDTLRMNSAGLARRGVEIVRDYDPLAPEIFTVKQKVLQILVNLVGNAKHACDASVQKNKRIAVSVKANEDGVRIVITDNGVGIPPENLPRIFNHGFTTRKNGHGFGLHSGALTARELGGALTAHSDGAGCGATFVLELPRQQPEP